MSLHKLVTLLGKTSLVLAVSASAVVGAGACSSPGACEIVSERADAIDGEQGGQGGAAGSLVAEEVTVHSLHAAPSPQRGEQGEGLYLSGGQCAPEDVGVVPWQNVVFRGGLASEQLKGEAGQLVMMYGDYRGGIAEWVAGELGYVGLPGYDTAENGLERTPAALRFHTGSNPATGRHVNLLIQSTGYLGLEGNESIQQELHSPGAYQLTAWSSHDPSDLDAGDGQGGYQFRINRRVTTEPGMRRALFLGNHVSYGQQAFVECSVRGLEVGGAREQYHFRFDWLGGSGPFPAHIENFAFIEAPGAREERRDAILVYDTGAGGNVRMDVTGLPDVRMSWTMFCRLDVSI